MRFFLNLSTSISVNNSNSPFSQAVSRSVRGAFQAECCRWQDAMKYKRGSALMRKLGIQNC